ncbi:hypothetical protein LshimejAT787_1900930 [Lyophyllum shimeji]|uniref:Uncharacterized protein n=1 Tax=Lyophyllum shimeji TaxID=47721 RepID=A0A9P3PXT8_LYOSH|nr:hypothetical protein LshimejAT787_1900930 [Lyophyllum shimeji]
MESFIHVVLYHGLRYFGHSDPASVPLFLRDIFEYNGTKADCTTVGGLNKKAMFKTRAHLGIDFQFNSAPLDEWVDAAFDAAKEWIEYVERPRREKKPRGPGAPAPAVPPPPAPSDIALRDHTAMANLFNDCLALPD